MKIQQQHINLYTSPQELRELADRLEEERTLLEAMDVLCDIVSIGKMIETGSVRFYWAFKEEEKK